MSYTKFPVLQAFFHFALVVLFCLAVDSYPTSPLLGGETTVVSNGSRAFSQPAQNLPVHQLRQFTFGNRLFNTQWINAPASVDSFDGLGPLFNRSSCSGCHLKDGRGQPPTKTSGRLKSMLVRLSAKGSDGEPVPHPFYGEQFNEQAIIGFQPEGQVAINYTQTTGNFPDGESFTLRQPNYQFEELAYGDLGDDVMFSGRVAQAVYGLGLLEAIPESLILEWADADDQDKDGISGRANWVPDLGSGQITVGRFGWKAGQPNLLQQAASAFLNDIGITSSTLPVENWISQNDSHKQVISGGKPELSDSFLQKITFYLQTLAVPAQRNWDDPKVVSGQILFEKIGCANCHRPNFKTGNHPTVEALSQQEIYPFTDLLLHDMGAGLADNRPEFLANGREWRTPPLWGIGLVRVVNGHTFFLHDGRARNLQEAILWHGGEAERSRRNFISLSKSDRDSLLSFLNSL